MLAKCVEDPFLSVAVVAQDIERVVHQLGDTQPSKLPVMDLWACYANVACSKKHSVRVVKHFDLWSISNSKSPNLISFS